MALVLADRVQELTTTSGTGTLTLNGALPGFQTFSAGVGNGNTSYYTIYDPTTYDWEVGIGTVGAGTLTRDTVLSNSLGTTAKINLAGNQTNVFVTYPAEKSVNLDANGVLEVGETISYADTGIISTFASTVAGYNQVILQNKSTATNASVNLNVSNDASSASNGFAELGINSSTFSNGPGCFNIPNAAYVASAGADLSIGTYNAYDIHFATNSSTTDAMTIFDNGGTSLGGYGNPGIGNLAVNKIVSGVSTITASAGTTVLNAASTYYQHVVGTTTHTIQLPDATTLLEGTTFIIDNDSTGNVTVTDFATASVDVLPSGGLSYLYLTDNSTVAGSWTAHGYLPSIYNFNNTTADFANATIVNSVWNGTAIAPGYGGTGLTTFVAANNALYSTGASTLTAGTLPVAAGGTGNTSGQAASVANALSAGTGLNFTGGGSFNGSAAKTINLADTSVTPASYTYASITVDAQGRLTAASSGTAPVTSVGATAPVASSGGTTPTISMTQANSTTDGYLSATDWNTFNNKGSGTVTSITAGSYLTGGTITTSGTIAVDATDANTASKVVARDASGNFSAGTVTVSGLSDSGNLTFTGTGNRITGDFSNVTNANRVAFQTSTVNGQTNVNIIPNGTNTGALLDLYNSSSMADCGIGRINMNSTDFRILSTILGTGTYLPMTFYTGGSERMRIDTSGNVGIGNNSPSTFGKLTVVGQATKTIGIPVASNGTTASPAETNLLSSWFSTGAYEAGIYSVNTFNSNFGNGLTFKTTDTGGTTAERMRITSNGGVSFGSSGTAYGSSGQVLQSNGDAPPTWVTPSSGGGYSVSVIGTNTNAAAGTLYVLTASLTLTLPASPTTGAQIAVSNLSGTTTAVIGRNGEKIMNLSEDMTVDVVGAGLTLVYSGASYGWVIL